jgi:hypothetical protein
MWTKLTTWLAINLVCISVLPGGDILCFGADGHCDIESLYAKGCSPSQPADDLPGIGSRPACFDLSISDTVSYNVAARKTFDISTSTIVFQLPVVSVTLSRDGFVTLVLQLNPGDLHAFRDTVILLN